MKKVLLCWRPRIRNSDILSASVDHTLDMRMQEMLMTYDAFVQLRRFSLAKEM